MPDVRHPSAGITKLRLKAGAVPAGLLSRGSGGRIPDVIFLTVSPSGAENRTVPMKKNGPCGAIMSENGISAKCFQSGQNSLALMILRIFPLLRTAVDYGLWASSGQERFPDNVLL